MGIWSKTQLLYPQNYQFVGTEINFLSICPKSLVNEEKSLTFFAFWGTTHKKSSICPSHTAKCLETSLKQTDSTLATLISFCKVPASAVFITPSCRSMLFILYIRQKTARFHASMALQFLSSLFHYILSGAEKPSRSILVSKTSLVRFRSSIQLFCCTASS